MANVRIAPTAIKKSEVPSSHDGLASPTRTARQTKLKRMPTTAVDTYALTPDQVDFRDTIRQIVRERVAPRAAEIDAKAEYPWDLRKLFAEQDLLGLPFEERVRRDRHRRADAQRRDRGGREGVRLDRADPDAPGPRHAADQAVRHRGAQAALPAQVRQRRVVAGVRAVRARGGLGPGRDDHQGGQGRRRVGRHRDQELDLQPRDRRLLHRLRQDRPERGALARDQRLRRRGRPPRASPSASSSTSSASRARPPASRSSTTSASPPRT